MVRSYCTLFDHHYLSRGLALYESLMKYDKEFMIYILAMDDEAFKKLKALNLPRVTVISMGEFEDDELREVKSKRSAGEYCWTCKSAIVLYVLQNYKVDTCIYIDSDIYFFGNPQILLNELGSNSVLITRHNYYYDREKQEKENGIYCVQFMPFKNSVNGIAILKDWKMKCINWCYNRHEQGLYGDQKYLDTWLEDYTGVCELEHKGAVGPWNVMAFDVLKEKECIYIREKVTGRIYPLIFYHFSQLEWFDKDVIHLDTNYREIDKDAVKFIYGDYVKKLLEVNEKYSLKNEKLDYNCVQHFRSDNLDALKKEKGYYRKSELAEGIV